MKTARVLLSVFALAAVCAAGTARAENEAPSADESVRVAEAQAPAPGGDSRPATLGDIRHTDAKISELRKEVNAQNQELRAEFRSEMRALREDMNQMFYTLLAAMIALFGLPHLPTWWGRLRENGKTAGAAGIFLVVLTAGAPPMLPMPNTGRRPAEIAAILSLARTRRYFAIGRRDKSNSVDSRVSAVG